MNIWRISDYGMHVNKYSIRVGSFVESIFGVYPIAPGHTAGAVWTADGWKTVCWAEAAWMENPDEQFEQWKVILYIADRAIHPGADPTFRIWYALYVRDAQGNVVWDNNNGWNYEYIIKGPYPEITPVSCHKA